MKRTLLAAAAASALAIPAAAAGAGASGPAFYVDGTLYRTVATPTDLTGTGGPAQSRDTIYDFGGVQTNVATAAPGDRDYNGGRWEVHAVTFTDYQAAVAAYDTNGSGDFDGDAELAAALAAGSATDHGVVKEFVCPVIKLPSSMT